MRNVKKTVSKKKKGISALALVLAILISLFAGMILGASVLYTNGDHTKYESIQDINSIEDAYNKIVNEYYGELDKEKLKNTAIEAMFNSLDTHTEYYEEGEAISFNNRVNGEYKGLGIEATTTNKGILVVRVLPSSPSEIAGLKANDIITKLNNESLKGKTAVEFTSMISKLDGELNLTILRNNKEKDYKVTLGNVVIDSVKSDVFEINNKRIGYIDIDLFSLNSGALFKKELNKIEESGIDSLIIDVRDNAGGYLSQVTDILKLFLKRDQILYKLQSKLELVTEKDDTDEYRGYSIVVLTNEASASASEILSAALKDNLGAILVGKKTYGKGSAQETANLSGGGMVKMTTKVWLTPNGECIDKVGIKPDYDVTLDKEYYNSPSNETDNQLQKAIEILK